MTDRPTYGSRLAVEAVRPWGSFRVLDLQADHSVKRLVVSPGCRLSMQRHHRRAEHWYVVSGVAEVELIVDAEGGEESRSYPVGAGTGSFFRHIDIPIGALHRLHNPGPDPLVVIEVQTGDYFGEDDIERRADDFGRVDQ